MTTITGGPRIRNMPKRKILFTLIYILFAGIGVFLGLEVLTRLLRIAPSVTPRYVVYENDSYLPFKPKPLMDMFWQNAEFEGEYATNSLGLRDTEHVLAKPEGTFRILGLGDSFTFGVGAAFEETYLYRLEEMLNNRPEKHPEIEIIKAGIPRYFPAAERLFLEHYGLDFEPDLILVGFVPNDIGDTHVGLGGIRATPNGYLYQSIGEGKFGNMDGWLYVNSHVFRIVIRKYAALTRANQMSAAERLEMKQEIETEYVKMEELADQIGARIVLAHIPQRGPWDQDAHSIADWMAGWSDSRDVPFIDTLPAMEAASRDQQLYWEQDGHCTPAGYEVIANTIFSYLVDNHLVP